MKQIKLSDLTPYEIIMAMVEGLRNPPIQVSMSTYGEVRSGVCFGCAATCTIIRLFEMDDPSKFLVHELDSPRNVHLGQGFYYKGSGFYDDDVSELADFEIAIDNLRRGDIERCNRYLPSETQHIRNPLNWVLPYLTDDYGEEQLMIYEQLANDNKPN